MLTPDDPLDWAARLASSLVAIHQIVPGSEDLHFLARMGRLWQDSRLVAVIDWEGSVPGDPALNIAYCAVAIRYRGLNDAARHFVSEYQRLSGRGLVNFD